MATKSTKSLATMTAAERLAFYREVNKQVRPQSSAGDVSFAERTAMLAAEVPKFGENFMAAYRYHRNHD